MDTLISHSPEETRALGEKWGREARRGLVIGLTGDLGAGKTQLVKGLARGLGVTTARITSPSFALVNEYREGRLALFHLDLYRLDTPEQIIGAGLEHYLFDPDGVAVVEWMERWLGKVDAGWRMSDAGISKPASGIGNLASSRLPYRFRHVLIETMGETTRQISYEDFGS
jgi:tRNA threonylcarbamoyladenosine biosynthesis protein TsaE